MFRQKQLKCLFQYTLLAGSIFSATVYANEINIQIKIGTLSRILHIKTVQLPEDSAGRDATTGNLDVINFADPLGSEATLPPYPPFSRRETYQYPNLPLIELTIIWPEDHKLINLKMTELYYWEWEGLGYPGLNQNQRIFHLSFQLPFFSIIPLNHEPGPARLIDEYFSVSFNILFTDNTLTRLRIEYSPDPERTNTIQYIYYDPNRNNWLTARSLPPNLHFQNFLQWLYRGARQLALYLPMIFAQLHNRLFTNPVPPVMDEDSENSTLEHQPDNAQQVLRADVSMPLSAKKSL